MCLVLLLLLLEYHWQKHQTLTNAVDLVGAIEPGVATFSSRNVADTYWRRL